MAKTYEPIATYTMPSAAASYTFTSISQSYTDLILIMAMVAGSTNYDVRVGNGSVDTGTNYSSTRLFGNGTTAGSDYQNNNNTGVMGNFDNSTTTTSNQIIQFQNYSNSTTNKSALSKINRADSYVFAVAGIWRSNSAINTVNIWSTNASNLPAGCTFTLYGILKA